VPPSAVAPALRIAWCDAAAARYAVEHWHYSRTLPFGRLVSAGVWERGEFIGAVIFGRGANRNAASPYKVSRLEIAELVRVALRKHETPVSRIVAIAVRMLRAQSPGLRLLFSYADPSEGHHGGIYQAGGWVYVGTSSPQDAVIVNGRVTHKHAASWKLGDVRGLPRAKTAPKHKYLLPLDPAMRAQVAPLARLYPKRSRVESAENGTAIPIAGGGVNPTSTLQSTDPPCPE